MYVERDDFLEIWKRSLAEKEDYINQMRAVRHDMQAHLMMLQYYLEAERYDKAKAYLNEMRDNQMSVSKPTMADTGNILIDVLVETYTNRDNEIRFLCEGQFDEMVGLSDYELCVVFSNLISNAVEACEKLTKSPKEIYMKLQKEKNQFQIKVENYIDWEIDVSVLGNTTTKSDVENHGYGIQNLRKIVETHEGNTRIEIVENKFCVTIYLPLVEA